MLAIFCLRLACGMLACLLILPAASLNPRFFRTHFLTALGLTCVAMLFLHDIASPVLSITLATAVGLTVLGSMSWMLENAPGGRALLVLAVLAELLALPQAGYAVRAVGEPWWLLADDLSAAAILGSTITAMLIGHSYLMAPAMSLAPLYRLLGLQGVSITLRIVVAGTGLWLWTGAATAPRLDTEMLLWLAIRWLIGLLGPLGLCWMAWETARIRSTQSATGILYVVVILCFLGELTSQLLLERTGYTL
jgi:hypothetical protein